MEPNDNGIEVKSPTGCDIGNNDLNAPANVIAPLGVSNSNPDGEQGRSFNDEADVFNKWVMSCQRSASAILNSKFFELLKYFSDSLTAGVKVYDGAPLECSIDLVRDIEVAGKPDIDDLKCKNQSVLEKNGEAKESNNENGESQRITGSNYVADDNSVNSTGAIKMSDKDSTGTIVDGDAMGETNFVEFIKSQKSEIGEHTDITNRSILVCKCGEQMSKTTDCKCYNKQRLAEQTDFENDVADLVEEDSSDDEGGATNVNFLDMFKSQKADCYIEDYYMNKIDEVVPSSEAVAAVDDDDDVSMGDSPEFFSGLLQKKTTQTKLKDCFSTAFDSNAPKTEFTNRCSPSSAPLLFAEAKSVTTDRIPTGAVTVPSPRTGYKDDDDMNFMFADYYGDSTNVFTQREMKGGGGSAVTDEVSARNEIVDNNSGEDVFAGLQTLAMVALEQRPLDRQPDDNRIFSPMAVEPCSSDGAFKTNVQPVTAFVPQSYDSGLVPFNIMKACNLLKPGFSLKRNKPAITTTKSALPAIMTTAAVARQTVKHDDVSPIRLPEQRRLPAVFSQSTPKIFADAPLVIKQPREHCATDKVMHFLTSSSDDDDAEVFVNENKATGGSRRPVPKKRRPKRKKVSFPCVVSIHSPAQLLG